MLDASVVASVLITVPERAEECARTLDQFAATGRRPSVVMMMPENWPRNEVSHGRVARLALRKAIEAAPPDYRAVLLVEDDIDVAPELWWWLLRLAERSEVVTLYLPGTRFYPAEVRRLIAQPGQWLPRGLTRVMNLGQWYGSQALLIPRWLVSGLVDEPGVERGFDIIVRERLLGRGRGELMTVVPNLVQHRAPPSVISRRYKPHRSVTYGR